MSQSQVLKTTILVLYWISCTTFHTRKRKNTFYNQLELLTPTTHSWLETCSPALVPPSSSIFSVWRIRCYTYFCCECHPNRNNLHPNHHHLLMHWVFNKLIHSSVWLLIHWTSLRCLHGHKGTKLKKATDLETEKFVSTYFWRRSLKPLPHFFNCILYLILPLSWIRVTFVTFIDNWLRMIFPLESSRNEWSSVTSSSVLIKHDVMKHNCKKFSVVSYCQIFRIINRLLWCLIATRRLKMVEMMSADTNFVANQNCDDHENSFWWCECLHF